MWLLATGFGLDLGLWQVLTMLSVLVVGLMVPGGPGMAGNFQYFLLIGASLFLATESPSIGGRVGAFAGLLHILQFVVISIPGFVVLATDKEARQLVRQTALSEVE